MKDTDLPDLLEFIGNARDILLANRSVAERIRSHYKYQNEETDSMSENFIVSYFNTVGELEGLLDSINELNDHRLEEEDD